MLLNSNITWFVVLVYDLYVLPILNRTPSVENKGIKHVEHYAHIYCELRNRD